MITTTRILPPEPEMAVRKLIDITERLIVLMEDESQAVARSDTVLFIATNKDKQKLADLYEQSAREFKTRLEDFRGVDRELLDQLERAQQALGELTRANMHTLETASIANA